MSKLWIQTVDSSWDDNELLEKRKEDLQGLNMELIKALQRDGKRSGVIGPHNMLNSFILKEKSGIISKEVKRISWSKDGALWGTPKGWKKIRRDKTEWPRYGLMPTCHHG